MAVVPTLDQHIIWALKAAGADKVAVYECHISGEDTIAVKVGDVQFKTTFCDASLQEVYQKTVERIRELKIINDVKQRLKG